MPASQGMQLLFPVLLACWKPLEFSGVPENFAHSKTAKNFNLHNALDLRWEQEDFLWNHSVTEAGPLNGTYKVYPCSRDFITSCVQLTHGEGTSRAESQ